MISIFTRPIRPYRNLRRMRLIVNVLAKHGFGYLVGRLHLRGYLSWRRRWTRREAVSASRLSMAGRIRAVCEELGPTFIKLGQLLSTRPDLLPPEFISELSKLQDWVAPLPAEEILPIIEQSFNSSLEKVFLFFDPVPVASASMAQVYRATLPEGEKVVVKVRRPKIEEVIDADLAILSFLAGIVDNQIPEMRVVQGREVVEEFKRVIRRELDFTAEARNADRIRNNLPSDSRVHIPKVFWNYCRPNILVMERVEGIKLNEINKAERKFSGKELAQIITRCFMHQILGDGFFHADPHPGNLIIMQDGHLALLDFGMVGRLSPEFRGKVIRLIHNLIERDTERIAEVILTMAVISPGFNVRDFQWDIEDLLEQYYGLPLSKISLGKLIDEIGRIAFHYRIWIPRDMYLLSKTLLILEGVVRQLDPEFNLLETTRLYARSLLLRRISPREVEKTLVRYFEDTLIFLQNFPPRMNRFLDRVEKGELNVQFEPRKLEQLIAEQNRAFNRLALAFVITGFIVASSLLMQSKIGFQFLGLSLLGIIGYLVAGVLIVFMILSIFRSGR